MESGFLRVPVTNNDTVLGDAQFSKSSTFAPSARLLCSFSLILRVERFGLEVCGELGAAGWTRTDGGLAPGPTSTTGPDPNHWLLRPWVHGNLKSLPVVGLSLMHCINPNLFSPFLVFFVQNHGSKDLSSKRLLKLSLFDPFPKHPKM